MNQDTSDHHSMAESSSWQPVFQSSWQPSTLSLSCPQIPPLNNVGNGKLGWPAGLSPSTDSLPDNSSAILEPSWLRSRRSSMSLSSSNTSRIVSYQRSHIPTPSRSNSSSSSPLYVAVSTRTSVRHGSSKNIQCATMQGLVRYLLLNPNGEQSSGSRAFRLTVFPC
jgi:hypothetical protein